MGPRDGPNRAASRKIVPKIEPVVTRHYAVRGTFTFRGASVKIWYQGGQSSRSVESQTVLAHQRD